MPSVFQVKLSEIEAMLEKCSPGARLVAKLHHFWVFDSKGGIYRGLPLGKHGKRGKKKVNSAPRLTSACRGRKFQRRRCRALAQTTLSPIHKRSFKVVHFGSPRGRFPRQSLAAGILLLRVLATDHRLAALR
jgi:hypothetical protein